MKFFSKKLFSCLLLTVAVILVAGCSGPRLAHKGLTPTQRQWAKNLKQMHPAWKVPYNSPLRQRREGAGSLSSTRVRSGTSDSLKSGAERRNAQGQDIEIVPVKKNDGTASAGEVGSTTYTVKKGDTLSGIAEKHYGSAAKWKKIRNANSDVLDSPDDLVPGLELEIP